MPCLPKSITWLKFKTVESFDSPRSSDGELDDNNKITMSKALREWFSTLSAIIFTRSSQISSSLISEIDIS